MCGIIGYTGSQNASPILLDGLSKMEYRGYDSAGIAVLNNGIINVAKAQGRLSNLLEMTDNGRTVSGFAGIGHTRWATHGAPNDINSHPHVSGDGRFAIVHNGIIENFAAIKEELGAKGHVFVSETDTEVVAHLIEDCYSGDFKAAVMKAVSRLEGAYALGIVCADFPDTVFGVSMAAPLIIGLGFGENFFASDVTALVSYTKNVIYLDDGEFAEVRNDGVTVYDSIGKPITKQVSKVAWSIEAAEKGGYEHFMLKEIVEQPAAVREAIAPRIKGGEIVLDDFELSEEDLKSINKIVITACGSAYHAGCCGRYAIEKLTRIPVEVKLASELRYEEPIIDSRTLVIIVSQSGETADTKAALEEAKRLGASTLAIVNVVGSTIARLADHVLYEWAGPEIAVATTKGFTTQLVLLYLFALYAAKKLKKVDDFEYARLLGEICSLPKRIQNAIDAGQAYVPRLADKYHDRGSMFFIGRNTDYAVALEGALKLKEISYIHAEAYAAGELKHGTIALIEEGTPVVAVCCNEDLVEKTANNILEVKARGAEVLALSFRENRDIITHADDVLFIPKTETVFSEAVAIIPLQLLAYYVAKANGCDIDKPRNLAKSVTVE